MAFELTRLVLFALIAVLCFLLVRKMKKRWAAALTCVAGLAVYCFFAVVPVENLFLGFDTPESAFRYYCKGEIIDIEHGSESCMVFFSRKANEGGIESFPKTEKGYKLPGFYDQRKVVSKMDGEWICMVYTLSGTDDYYLFVMTIAEEDGDITVTDSNGRQLDLIVMESGAGGQSNVFVNSFIEDYTPDYTVYINDKAVALGKPE